MADEQEVTADQHRTYRTVQRPGTSAETANEAEYEVIRTEHGEDFDEKLEPEQNRYLNQVDALLSVSARAARPNPRPCRTSRNTRFPFSTTRPAGATPSHSWAT